MATIRDGQIVIACSWCHAIVKRNMLLQAATYCPTCRHRADVARVDCTCVRCQLAKAEATS